MLSVRGVAAKTKELVAHDAISLKGVSPAFALPALREKLQTMEIGAEVKHITRKVTFLGECQIIPALFAVIMCLSIFW